MRKKRTKVITISVAATILLCTLSGCTGNSPSNPSQNAEGEAAASDTQEPVTLTFGYNVASLDSGKEALINQFMEENPDIKIEVVYSADNDEHIKKIKLAAQTNTLPDIFWMTQTQSDELWEAGCLLDLTDIIKEDPDLNAKLYERLNDLSTAEDKAIYGLPYEVLGCGFWYNKEVFQQYGVNEPQPGTTYGEFADMIDTFSRNDVVTIPKGAKSPFSVWTFMLGLSRYGYYDRIGNILLGKDSFTNDDFLRYFQKIEDMQKRGAFSLNTATMTNPQARELFLAGNSAMFDSGTWDTEMVNEAMGEKAGFWWGPVFEDGVGNQKTSMTAWTIALRFSSEVAKDSKKLDAVRRLIRYWVSDHAEQTRIDTGYLPITTFDGNYDQASPAFKAILEAKSLSDWESVPYQADAVLSETVANALYDAIFGVICGNYTPEKALNLIDEAQKRALED